MNYLNCFDVLLSNRNTKKLLFQPSFFATKNNIVLKYLNPSENLRQNLLIPLKNSESPWHPVGCTDASDQAFPPGSRRPANRNYTK